MGAGKSQSPKDLLTRLKLINNTNPNEKFHYLNSVIIGIGPKNAPKDLQELRIISLDIDST